MIGATGATKYHEKHHTVQYCRKQRENKSTDWYTRYRLNWIIIDVFICHPGHTAQCLSNCPNWWQLTLYLIFRIWCFETNKYRKNPRIIQSETFHIFLVFLNRSDAEESKITNFLQAPFPCKQYFNRNATVSGWDSSSLLWNALAAITNLFSNRTIKMSWYGSMEKTGSPL